MFGGGDDNRVAITIELDTANLTPQLSALTSALQSLGKSGRDAGTQGAEGMKIFHTGLDAVKDKIHETVFELAGMVTAFLTIEKGIEAIFEGFQHADYLRDLRASTDALTGSAEAGAKAWERLQEVGEKTRATGDDLIQLFGRTLPLAMDRGFSTEGATKLVSQLAKLAPAIGQSVDQVAEQMNQILSGRVRKTNVLAHVLGLDPEAYTKGLVGLESVFPKIDELAAKGDKIGTTWTAAMAHVKDAVKNAFGDGVNDARDGVTSSMDSMLDTMRNPEFLQSIHEIGKAFAELVPVVATAVKGISDLIAGLIDSLKQMSGHGGDSGVQGTKGGGYWATVWDEFLGSDQTEDTLKAKFADRGIQLTRMEGAYKKQITDAQKLMSGLGMTGLTPVGFETYASAAFQKGSNAAFDSTLTGLDDKLKRVKAVLDTSEAAKIAKKIAEMTASLPSPSKLGDIVPIAGTDTFAGSGLFGKAATLSTTDPGFQYMQKMSTEMLKLRQSAEFFGVAMPKAFVDASDKAKDFLNSTERLQQTMKDTAAQAQKLRDLEGESKPKMLDDMQDQAERIGKAFADLTGSLGGFDISKIGDADEVFKRLGPDMEKITATVQQFPEAFAMLPESFQKAFTAFQQYNIGTLVEKELNKAIAAGHAFELEQAQLVAKITATNQLQGGINLSTGNVGLGVVQNQQALIDAYLKSVQMGMPLSEDMKKALDQLAKYKSFFSDDMKRAMGTITDSLGDAFGDLAATGGKNIGNIMANAFTENVKANGKELFGDLVNAAMGITKNPATGQFEVKDPKTGAVSTYADANAARLAAMQSSPGAAAAGIGFAAAQGGLSGYNSGASDLATGVSAAMSVILAGLATSWTGAGFVVAVVAAAATVVGKLLQPSPSEQYKYIMALHTDAAGIASGTGNKNVDKNELQGYLDTFTQTVDTFYNGYIKILLKFPNEILPKISASFQPIYGAFETGADLGMAASEHFADELQQYLKIGLPHDIGDRFSSYIQEGMVNLGMSAAKFDQIWHQLANLDPAKAMQGLSDLTDAMVGFNETLKLFNTPVFQDANHLHPLGGLFEQISNDMSKTFAQNLETSDKDIISLGSSLEDLIGPDQLSAAKDLATQMQQRYDKEKQFLQDIKNQIDSITNSFNQQMQGYTLAGMTRKDAQGNETPDYNAQAQYLRDQTQLLMAQLSNATSPEQVTSLYNQIAANIDKVYQTGSQLGPEAQKAFLKWAQENLQKAETAAIARQNELAQQVQDANDKFLAAIQGFIDAFENATGQLTGGETQQTGPGSIPYQQTHPNYVPLPGTPAYAFLHPHPPPPAGTDPVPDENGKCPSGWTPSADGKKCDRVRGRDSGATPPILPPSPPVPPVTPPVYPMGARGTVTLTGEHATTVIPVTGPPPPEVTPGVAGIGTPAGDAAIQAMMDQINAILKGGIDSKAELAAIQALMAEVNDARNRATAGGVPDHGAPQPADPDSLMQNMVYQMGLVTKEGTTSQLNALEAIRAVLASGQYIKIQIVDDAGNDVTPPDSRSGFVARSASSR